MKTTCKIFNLLALMFLISQTGISQEIIVKSTPTGIYALKREHFNCLTENYWDLFYKDRFAYLQPQIHSYEVSIINKSNSNKSYLIISGLWVGNWTLNNDSFQILDPYCGGMQNYEECITIKPYDVKRYVITLRAEPNICVQSSKNLKFGFYYFDATKSNAKAEFEKLHRGSEEEYKEWLSGWRRAVHSKRVGEYETWEAKTKFQWKAKRDEWIRTHKLNNGSSCGIIWED